jgi:hypothetical protein
MLYNTEPRESRIDPLLVVDLSQFVDFSWAIFFFDMRKSVKVMQLNQSIIPSGSHFFLPFGCNF